MSNINPLFILLVGATILSLVLVTEVYSIFAQEEDKEEKDKEDKDEEEKEESKDKDDDEKEEEGEEKEESKDEATENNNDTATTQIIQDQLTPSSPPPINNDTTTTIFQEPEPTIAVPVTPQEEEEEGEFNATCQCKTIPSKPKPKPTPPIDPPTNNEQIIPITSANIKDSQSFGQVTDPAYTSFYTVPNLLDTIIDDISFWSQAGTSGFYIKLDDTLDNYQVCSAELNGVHNPKSTPYLLDVGVSQNYTGVIDQTTEKIQFDKCVKNMDEIYMTFDSPSGNYISISEIKLFGSKLGATQPTIVPPTLQPPLIPNETEETENATKINIENSNAEIDIKNSTVTFKFDPMTATFVQQGGGVQ